MSESAEKDFIEFCLTQIEQKLAWGPNQGWSNYDFEKLSEIIEAKTQVVLSITTLKRIWGKVKYDHAPSLTTLNTLARFIDFEDWRNFKLKSGLTLEKSLAINEEKISIPIEPTSFHHQGGLKTPKKARPIYLSIGIIGIIGLCALAFVAKKKPNSSPLDPDLFSFEANKVLTKGIPNSVVFHYDATRSLSDSVYISQTWDVRRKVLVDKNKHEHSAIYYYPGYFKSKLIIDSVIVRTHELQIATDGWLVTADVPNNGIPMYFKKSDIEKPGLVEVNETTLKNYNLDLMPKSPTLRFFNQGDLGMILDDNFTFETTLKNDHVLGDNACQFVQVLIQCKDDIIIVPLSAKSCIGDLKLSFAGAQVYSKEADMSGFGCDLTQWTSLKIVAKNKLVQLYVNGNKAYELTFPNRPTEIVGLQYRFNGVGAIRQAKFTTGDKEIVLQ